MRSLYILPNRYFISHTTMLTLVVYICDTEYIANAPKCSLTENMKFWILFIMFMFITNFMIFISPTKIFNVKHYTQYLFHLAIFLSTILSEVSNYFCIIGYIGACFAYSTPQIQPSTIPYFTSTILYYSTSGKSRYARNKLHRENINVNNWTS